MWSPKRKGKGKAFRRFNLIWEDGNLHRNPGSGSNPITPLPKQQLWGYRELPGVKAALRKTGSITLHPLKDTILSRFQLWHLLPQETSRHSRHLRDLGLCPGAHKPQPSRKIVFSCQSIADVGGRSCPSPAPRRPATPSAHSPGCPHSPQPAGRGAGWWGLEF